MSGVERNNNNTRSESGGGGGAGGGPSNSRRWTFIVLTIVAFSILCSSANTFRHHHASAFVVLEAPTISTRSTTTCTTIPSNDKVLLPIMASPSGDDYLSSLSSSTNSSSSSQQQQRTQLKRELLKLADEFQEKKRQLDKERLDQMAEEERREQQEDASKNYVWKLVGRVMRKIMGRKKKKGGGAKDIINSKTLGTSKLDTGEKGKSIIEVAEQLAPLNPTEVPTKGWKGYGGSDPSDCKLGGTWKLRFTTAADATFPASPKRGNAITSQEIDPNIGTLTNVVDFEKGKLKGFRVVVAGDAASDTKIELTFRRVVILRDSRFPRLFGKLVFPIPARLFRLLNRFLSSRNGSDKSSRAGGPYFELQYIDHDLRMHKTGEGNWFIQSRLK